MFEIRKRLHVRPLPHRKDCSRALQHYTQSCATENEVDAGSFPDQRLVMKSIQFS